MIGKSFSRWTVISISYPSPRGCKYYNCQCSCGTLRRVSGAHLRIGHSTNCGCRRKESLAARNYCNPSEDLPGERWIPIPFTGAEVSTLGRVRHIATKHIYARQMDDQGYPVVSINKKLRTVHRLVGVLLIPNPLQKKTINHIDGDKENCALANLEWATQPEQMIHAKAIGLMASMPGSLNSAAKLTEEEVIQIRRWYPLGLRQIDLAAAFGVSQRAISLIVRREKWQHV